MAITGLPLNRINVINRRAGGGFGGKLSRQLPVCAAAALGALVTGKQVHVQLDRVQDLSIVSVPPPPPVISPPPPSPPPQNLSDYSCLAWVVRL